MHDYSRLQRIEHPLFRQHQIKVSIKRDDLLHPIISGNKWRKLKYNLLEAKSLGKKGIVSFGGSYSNHIHALAYACQQHGLHSIGIIRGEPQYRHNFTLSCARHWGMALHFVERQQYRRRYQADYLSELQQQYPDYAIVPEGGSNALALPGVGEIITELEQQGDYDQLLLPVGSGGTLAGLIAADHNQHRLTGIAVLKQADYLNEEVMALLPETAKHYANWQLCTEFHRGGYGKFSRRDCQRILDFCQQSGVPFEPVYSGKMLLALLDLLAQGYFSAGQHIVLLHTGGLQGLAGLVERGLLTATDWPWRPSLESVMR